MEITNFHWLERKPTRQAVDEEKLIYKLQLLIENQASISASPQTRLVSAQLTMNPLRFDVPGCYNGRLFDCRLTISARETYRPHWKNDFAQALRVLCRAYWDAHEPLLDLA